MFTSFQNPFFPQGVWEMVKDQAVEPVAAGVAIVPVFYGFQVKSAQQTGEPIPRYTPFTALRQGVKTAPLVGTMVGVQRIFQNLFEGLMQQGESKNEGFLMPFMSAAVVGFATAPFMAIFSALSQGKKARHALRHLTIKQALATSVMEVGFLAGMGAINPMVELFRERFGQNRAVDNSATFASGALGALFGHAGDTALSMWQKGMKIERLSQLARGAPTRAAAVGIFSCIYNAVKEAFA